VYAQVAKVGILGKLFAVGWRVALAALVALVVGLGLWMAAREARVGVVPALERELEKQTGLRAAIEGTAWTLWPPSARAERVVLGEPEEPALVAQHLRFSLDPRESFRQWHPTVWVSVKDLSFDSSKLPLARRPSAPEKAVRCLWLPSARVSVGRFRGSFGRRGRSRQFELSGAHLDAIVRDAGIRLVVTAAWGQMSRGATRVPFGEVEVRLRRTREQWFLESFSVKSDALSVAGQVQAAATIAFEARIALSAWEPVLGTAVGLAGTLAVAGRLEGDLVHPNLFLEAAGEDLSIWGWRAPRLRAHAVLTDGRLEVEALEAEVGKVGIRGRGGVEFREPYPAQAELVLHADKAAVGRLGKRQWQASGEAHMTLRLSLSPFKGEGRLAVRIADLRAERFEGPGLSGGASAEGAFSRNGFQVTARAALGRSVGIEGHLASGPDIRGEFHASVADASELRPLWPGLAGGKIEAGGSLRGTRQEPEVDFQLRAKELVMAAALRIDSVEATGVLGRTRLANARAEIRMGAGRLAASGEVAMDRTAPNAFAVEARQLDLGALRRFARGSGMPVPDLRGALDGSVRVHGSWGDAIVEGEASVSPMLVGPEKLERVVARAEVLGDRWRASVDVTRAAGETARVEGTGVGTEQWRVQASSTPWALGGFGLARGRAGALGGTAAMRGELRGSPRRPTGQIHLLLRDLAFAGRALGALEATATAARGRWQVEGRSADGRITLRGQVAPEGRAPFSVDAAVAAMDFGPWLAGDAGLRLTAGVELHATGSVRDGARALEGEIVLSHVEVARDNQGLAAPGPVVLRGQKGRYELEPFELRGELGSLAAGGTFGADGALDAWVRGDVDARVFELLGQRVTSARGIVFVQAAIQRTPAGQWRLDGAGEVKDVALDLGLPFALAETNGVFRFAGDRVEAVEIRGRVGGGELAVRGAVVLGAGPVLQWEVAEASTGLIEDVEDRVSGSGEVLGTWRSPIVRGDITVISALYQHSVELTDLVALFRRKVRRPAPSPEAPSVGLDLHVHAADSLFVDTDVAQAEFRADLRVTGTSAAPLLDGRIELLTGSVTVGRAELAVTEGLLVFRKDPENDPELRFVASGPVRSPEAEYQVVARVTGTLRDYRVLLSSEDGGLSQRDVLSLLATGRTTAELGQNRGNAVGSMVMLAPSLYGRGVTRGLKRVLPVDRLEVQPAFSRTTGAFEPRVSVGKDITERLRASAGSTFGVQGKNDVSIEYDLVPGVTLGGSWESRTERREGAFGGDIKFRREFGSLRDFSLLP